MGDDGGELLRGERLRWTGRPARVRVTLADAGVPLLILVALTLIGVFSSRLLTEKPRLLGVLVVVFWAGALLQAIPMLARQLVLGPATRRRSAYQVTDYRVLVTTGSRRRQTWSAYLDQIDEPTVRRHRNGTEDLLLRGREPASREIFTWADTQSPFGLGQPRPFPVLNSLTDSGLAQQATSRARRQMLDGMLDAPTLDGPASGVALPAAISMEPTERILWTGRPETVPWWFGAADVETSAFGLYFLTFVSLIGALMLTDGAAGGVVFVIPVAAAGLYLTAGRVILRRLRIRRSSYLLTDRRLITTWQLRGGPVVVQAPLSRLLPPEIRGRSILTSLARPGTRDRKDGWKNLAWPAATIYPRRSSGSGIRKRCGSSSAPPSSRSAPRTRRADASWTRCHQPAFCVPPRRSATWIAARTAPTTDRPARARNVTASA